MPPSDPASLRTPFSVLALILGIGIGAAPRAAVPIALARSFDSAGIGMVMGAGPIYDDRHGLAPNEITSQVWFHYFPTILGGAGLNISSRNPSRLESFNQTRYNVTSTWIPSSSPIHAMELSIVGSLNTVTSYLDTTAGADPIRDDGVDFGLSARIAYGRRLTGVLGWWISAAPEFEVRPFGANADFNPGLDAETGMTFSLLPLWHNAASLSRSWDIFLRIPCQIRAASPYLTKEGPKRGPTWSIGAQIGPSGLF